MKVCEIQRGHVFLQLKLGPLDEVRGGFDGKVIGERSGQADACRAAGRDEAVVQAKRWRGGEDRDGVGDCAGEIADDDAIGTGLSRLEI